MPVGLPERQLDVRRSAHNQYFRDKSQLSTLIEKILAGEEIIPNNLICCQKKIFQKSLAATPRRTTANICLIHLAFIFSFP